MQEVRTDVQPVAEPPQRATPVQVPAKKPVASTTPVQVDKRISTYNGAATERYNWSQSTTNVDV